MAQPCAFCVREPASLEDDEEFYAGTRTPLRDKVRMPRPTRVED